MYFGMWVLGENECIEAKRPADFRTRLCFTNFRSPWIAHGRMSRTFPFLQVSSSIRVDIFFSLPFFLLLSYAEFFSLLVKDKWHVMVGLGSVLVSQQTMTGKSTRGCTRPGWSINSQCISCVCTKLLGHDIIGLAQDNNRLWSPLEVVRA